MTKPSPNSRFVPTNNGLFRRVDAAGRPWNYGAHDAAPRRLARDAGWSDLYSANKGTIGSDPNKISPGMSLSLPGGGNHTVSSGESLSSIASQYGGGSSGSGSGSGWANPGERDYGGSSNAGVSSSPAAAASMGSSAPTPPSRPSEYGGSSSGGGRLPTSLMGGGGAPTGSSGTSGATPNQGSAGYSEPGSQASENEQRMLNEDDGEGGGIIEQITRAAYQMDPQQIEQLIEALRGVLNEGMTGDTPPNFPGCPNVGGAPSPIGRGQAMSILNNPGSPRDGGMASALRPGAMDSRQYEREQVAFFAQFGDAARIKNRGF
jgi:LysM repeat protein